MRGRSGFRRTRHGIEARFGAQEALVLRRLASQLVELLELGAAPVPGDPLEALVGMTAEELPPPGDEVLARLLPEGYRDDPESAAEFRRYTEPELRAAKRSALRGLVTGVPADGGRVILDEPAAQSWLLALNDLRLALGTRLGVTEDVHEEAAQLPPEDPRLVQLGVYEWLGGLQESLVRAVSL